MTILKVSYLLKHDGNDKLYWLYTWRLKRNFKKVYEYARKIANGEVED